MSLLSLITSVCYEVGLEPPSSVIGDTSKQTLQLLSIVNRVGDDLRVKEWPALTTVATITLAANQEFYALPADIDRSIYDTFWDTSNRFPLYGPLSNQTWELLKNSLISSSQFDRKFRFIGNTQDTFQISPIPDSTMAGQILVFEYQSSSWIRPTTWTPLTLFSGGSYCFYNGVYFYTAVSGTTGSTPPTVAAPNDGGINWTVWTSGYTTFTADTDQFNIDEYLVGLGVQWNYLAARGLPYMHLKDKYDERIKTTFAKVRGATRLSLVPKWRIGRPWPNVAETGFGF